MSDAYSKYAYLSDYVFGEVRQNFIKRKHLTTTEFFSIIIWKANRAKSKVANRILRELKFPNLSSGVKTITRNLYKAPDSKERLRYLIKGCGFRLPMASAILSVLYPNDFTVYDVRVCEILDSKNEVHGKLKNKSNFHRLWDGYQKYKAAVLKTAPSGYTLRQADNYLWGKSFLQQLKKDIKDNFPPKYK